MLHFLKMKNGFWKQCTAYKITCFINKKKNHQQILNWSKNQDDVVSGTPYIYNYYERGRIAPRKCVQPRQDWKSRYNFLHPNTIASLALYECCNCAGVYQKINDYDEVYTHNIQVGSVA